MTECRLAAACLSTLAILVAVIAPFPAGAGEPGAPGQYGRPSAAIVEALDARPGPVVEASPDGRHIALLFRRAMPSSAELAKPVLGLAGQLIDPASNGPARGILFDRVTVLTTRGAETVLELPPGARLSTVRWSPEGDRLAFLNHAEDSIELWTAEAGTGSLRLIARGVNATFAEPFAWLPGGSALLVRLVPRDRAGPPIRPLVPAGPEIRESDGHPAPVQTLSNLLQNAHDDTLFHYYFTSQLVLAGLDGSPPKPLGGPAIVHEMAVSPDGGHVLVERLLKPFSRAFTAPDFPRELVVLDIADGSEHPIASLPGADRARQLPDGADSGPRAVAWRSDQPATLTWAEARAKDDPPHDRLYQWQSPFARDAEVLADIEGRVVRVLWGRPDLAVLEVRRSDGGGTSSIVFDPARVGQAVATDRALPRHRDQRLLTLEGPEGSERLVLSDAGFPLALEDAGGSATDRILEWHAPDGAPTIAHEFPAAGLIQRIATVLDPADGTALAWRESATQPPNLFFLDAADHIARRLTDFADPAPAFADMRVIALNYRRDDGVPLTARLYLPAALAGETRRPLPTVFWAYPVTRATVPLPTEEQRDQPSRFVRPSGVDPLLLTASGYAVLVADMPVVEGDEGSHFIRQLVANATAAIDAGVASGWVDRARVAVAGHSFGAGMAVNLLASSDLFAAGIALSGAYNRTLTPFGFQTERRSLWEAPDIYREASPFLRADAIDAPLLLIHGTRDTNSGTLPMQSERLFGALRGLGKPARLVLLPGESHAYTARDSVFHAMFEIERWLDRFLRPDRAREGTPSRRLATKKRAI